MDTEDDLQHFDAAAERLIELGNRLLERDADADSWEVASGLLAGAVHFWLYAHQPCGDLECDSCEEIDTAEKRVEQMLALVRESAEESDYYHSPRDINVGSA
ncbi:MAG: hypothetical protein ACO3RT_01725 [Arenicellales bacterium]|jgi:hypothetical protein|nr:hypothetical protein [Gammaproteobacteria bacterium]NDA14228.1 hypothetical protein [Gammaproteobacteria bacterium]NDG43690.1 hypothetical protein [Gammaproteobacteria bacterium]